MITREDTGSSTKDHTRKAAKKEKDGKKEHTSPNDMDDLRKDKARAGQDQFPIQTKKYNPIQTEDIRGKGEVKHTGKGMSRTARGNGYQ